LPALCAAALVVVATGCGSAPPRLEPELDLEPASGWTAPGFEATEKRDAASESTGAWWTGFQDAALDSLVARALAHNHDLRAAALRVDAALAQARLAGAEALTQLNAGFSRTRDRRIFIGTPIPSSTSTIYDASLDASWEVDLWGRVRSVRSAALADAEAMWAEAQAAQLSLSGQTARAYFAVTESRRQLELADETVTSFRTALQSVRERFEQGTRPSLDVRLARSNLADAEALRARRRAQYDRSRRQLEILLGRYPAGVVEGADSLRATPARIPAGLPSDLLLRRPDVVAAERRLAAAGARVSEARRAFLPRLSLTGSAGSASSALDLITDADFFVWRLVGNLVQPIFQGGRLRARAQFARADAERLLATYAHTLLNAFAEVENALATETHLAEEELAQQESARQAVAAQALAEDRYRQGLEDLVTVLEAQRRALQARGSLISLRRQRLDARVNLHMALGGSFHVLRASGGDSP
jgi:NodT family efflux transporter outer membrane factor (OMF) lipoprotein